MIRAAKKGQVATEFMLYTTIFMFVAIAAFIIVNQIQSTEVPIQQNTVAKEIGEGFSSTFSLSVKGGTGFSYNYSFPRTIFGIPYKITFLENSIILDWEGSFGNYSSSYDIPYYSYDFGGCLQDRVLTSNECGNMLMLENNGEKLTITQVNT